MTHPTEFALRLVKQGFLQARPREGIGFLTHVSFLELHGNSNHKYAATNPVLDHRNVDQQPLQKYEYQDE